MKLYCYPTSGAPPKIVPASAKRDWMDRHPEGYAYRCLPLSIANAHGWMILNGGPFIAQWNGEAGKDAISIHHDQPVNEPPQPCSHFGSGILTFRLHCLFRTEPGYDLWVGGPTNSAKDAIQPLVGVVETDWSPAPFTMNWRFTRKNTPVAFASGEPICMIFPIPRGLVESVEPEFRALDSDPKLEAAYRTWRESRSRFLDDLQIAGSEAQRQKWQKDYFRGKISQAPTLPDDHRTKLRLKDFK